MINIINLKIILIWNIFQMNKILKMKLKIDTRNKNWLKIILYIQIWIICKKR